MAPDGWGHTCRRVAGRVHQAGEADLEENLEDVPCRQALAARMLLRDQIE